MKKFICLMALVVVVSAETLKVGIHDFPPCVMHELGEKPTGFDIEVFEAVAKNAGYTIDYLYPTSFPDLLAFVEKGFYDVGISGITITGDREKVMDFTHPYLNSGLMICINKDSSTNPLGTFWRYLNNMGPMLLVILIFTCICGVLIFFVEKKFSKENSMFNPDKPLLGILNGYYFSNVFSSTVGFGDLVPKSSPGKILTVIMVIIGVYFIFPYAIANMNMALQQERSAYSISSVEDLPGKIVATEEATTSEGFLKKLGCNVRATKSIDEAYGMLSVQKADAVVFDMPTIKYFVKNKGKNKLVTSGALFDRQTYGFALQQNSPYREKLNESLADFMRTDKYWELHLKWFGEE